MKKKILVLEDQFAMTDNIKSVLELKGYEVINKLSRLEDAIYILDKICVDLVMIDIGFKDNLLSKELVHHMNQTYKVPFIYITSYQSNKTLTKVLQTNTEGFIVKPFNSLDIVSVVDFSFKEFNFIKSNDVLINKVEKNNQIPYRISKVIKYIDDNIKERIEIDTLASITKWHKQHFIRTFQNSLNATPYQYILQKKIEMSCEMLIKSCFSCSEIAYEFGFLSYSNYSKAFKKVKGYSPKQYRLKYK